MNIDVDELRRGLSSLKRTQLRNKYRMSDENYHEELEDILRRRRIGEHLFKPVDQEAHRRRVREEAERKYLETEYGKLMNQIKTGVGLTKLVVCQPGERWNHKTKACIPIPEEEKPPEPEAAGYCIIS